MRVLIADDDPVYRTLTGDLLRQWDYEVQTASDGAEAWEAVQGEDSPRLVLLDWLMPGLDGFELCRKIRDSRHGSDRYIMILTGSRQKEEIIRVLIAGADDYLIKPFEPLDLKIHVRAAQRILDLRQEVADLRRFAVAPA